MRCGRPGPGTWIPAEDWRRNPVRSLQMKARYSDSIRRGMTRNESLHALISDFPIPLRKGRRTIRSTVSSAAGKAHELVRREKSISGLLKFH